jgi:hypothetical protein
VREREAVRERGRDGGMEGQKGVEYVKRSLKRVMDYIRKKSAGGLTVLKIIDK